MPHIRQFDHVGITVADLDSVTVRQPGSRGRGPHVRGGRVHRHGHRHPGLADRDRHAHGCPTEEPGSSLRASPGRPRARIAHRDGQRAGSAQHLFRGRRPPGGRRRPGCERIRTGRRDRLAREHLADGPCPRAGGNRRLADRADRLTPRGCPLPLRRSAFDREARLVGRLRAPEYRSDGAGGERPRHAALQWTRVALHAVWQICGLPAQDGIEPEQHDRRERIEQLRSADPEPGCEVDQAAPIEQEHPPTVELKALEMANRGAR